MPPKSKSNPAVRPASGTRDLIPTGPKDVQRHHSKQDDRLREVKPTTERALVLRNGKYGARGTGEMILMSKMTGREKLDLLAEDLVDKTTKALLTPFRSELCIKLAESQLSENLDDIANLKDPDLFFSIVMAEIKSRTSSGNESLNNPASIAQLVSDRIHNAYMLGSAWKIVLDILYSLRQCGLTDDSVIATLKTDTNLRSQYLVLYDLVTTLVDFSQKRFSLLATTAAHYASYFKEATTEEGEKVYFFDWQETRKACSSFLDSIIVELCFPRAPYPKAILYQILHDAVEESPKEARRFPQALWDAVGDLSVVVQLQQMIETPLLSPAGKQWKLQERTKLDQYIKWLDAQPLSEAASEKSYTFKDIIFPLKDTKQKDVLDLMWKTINENYKTYSGRDIDTLWGLSEVLNQPTPHWHSYGLLKAVGDGENGPSGGRKKKPIAITYDGESDSSIPPLQAVSGSDESDGYWNGDSEADDSSNFDESDDESDYDTDEEDEIRDLLREAMDAASAVNWQEPVDEDAELDPFTADDRKGNPFLKLLGSLRGRMFSKNPKLKTTSGTKLAPEPAEPKLAASTPPTAERYNAGVTIEEIPDEDVDTSLPKKRKKKKPKKKKPIVATGVHTIPEDVTAPPASPSPEAATAAPAVKPEPKAKVPPTKPKVSVAASQSTLSFFPLESVTTAQSARSYLQSEQLDVPKTKVKSRSVQPSLFSSSNGLFDKLGVGKEKKKDTDDDRKERRTWFTKLKKKTRTYMHQILNTAEVATQGSGGMKWDAFVKVMTDLGFTYDPSTAGSSVRFDPPDPRDRSISFHKPHPDSTITPVKLKEFSKKLRKYYGWDRADLLDI